MPRPKSFLAVEKKRQAAAKKNPALFGPAALPYGRYSSPTLKHPDPPSYPFCLPIEVAAENLFAPVRDQIMRFGEKGIPWHKGLNGGPTSHLCSSQVCCVNFLAPFADKPFELITLIQRVFPSAVAMLPVGDASGDDVVEFEWIGDPARDYLDEGGKQKRRTRGANCTSADAAVRYQDAVGDEHVVLIEWKYCESYPDLERIAPERRLLATNGGEYTPSAQTRIDRYEERLPTVATLPATVTFADLCVEPLYQLMRQQLLAHEMETTGQEATSVSVLHLAPRANHGFRTITSPALRAWAERELPEKDRSVTDAWHLLLTNPARFRHVAVEDFFAPALGAGGAELDAWRAYTKARYSWVW